MTTASNEYRILIGAGKNSVTDTMPPDRMLGFPNREFPTY